MMIRIISICIAFLVFACTEKAPVEKVDLTDFKSKLSYSLGADHAKGLSESGDQNFPKYKVDLLVEGFKLGVENEDAFDESCRVLMQKTFSKSIENIDTTNIKELSLCIGKLSGVFFHNAWKNKNALDKIDMKKLLIGYRHGLERRDTLIQREEQMKMIQSFIEDINKLNGEKLISEAKKRPNTEVTSSGVVIETLQKGSGTSPSLNDDVLAHYILINSYGDTLQSSFDMEKLYDMPLEPFSLKGVVTGWQEAFPKLQKGGKYKLYVPYLQAYGDQGLFNPDSKRFDVQPYESLQFYIEFIDFGKPGSLKK